MRLHDPECNTGASREAEATEVGGNDLVVTTAGAGEISEFAVLPAEAAGRVMIPEAAHAADPALDAATVLLKALVRCWTFLPSMVRIALG